ncbi:MAG TPA: protoglobin domain-containing protein [Pirellulales bacterium]|nr:protoglobin domain-containing protein [Pirellulales bacterium]
MTARDSSHPDPVQPPESVEPGRRLAFLDLSEGDAARLRGMVSDFERWADEFVKLFYEHLFAFDETKRFLKDADRVEWLKRAQREHFRSMLEAHWDDHYFSRRHKVGHTHAEVGIEPLYFLGAYNQYVQYSFDRLAERHGGDMREFKADVLSLLKVIFLDIGLTLDAYFAQSTRNLRHALDMFWKANAELRQFAQLTSHDLKTPLATVANLCDEAIDEFGDQMPEEARELVQAAKARTFRMSRMIDELLASAVAVENDGTNGPFSSQEALDEALELARPLLDRRGVKVSVVGMLPQVWGNKLRLREVFTNLITNAAKFIHRAPAEVTIDARCQGDQCEIVVADNGPGIPADELDRIFVPFRRLAMHRDLPGSGLGLYFTRNLVTQQEGRIWATSESGKGSQFHIELRLARGSVTGEK